MLYNMFLQLFSGITWGRFRQDARSAAMAARAQPEHLQLSAASGSQPSAVR